MEEEKPAGVPSPCVNVCTLDPSDDVCTGCGRTRAEIWAWTRCNDALKEEILRNAALRMTSLKK